jgi:hypothetical protein
MKPPTDAEQTFNRALNLPFAVRPDTDSLFLELDQHCTQPQNKVSLCANDPTCIGKCMIGEYVVCVQLTQWYVALGSQEE